MTKYIIKKMVSEWKETAGNIIFVSCFMAVLIICLHVAARIQGMVKNEWYKNSLEVASINDAFIREKMGAILWAILVLLGIISIFCLFLYALKLKLEIVKESRNISVFQVLGYTMWRRTGALYVGKMLEILISSIISSILSYVIWNCLCNQKIFLGLMTMMDEKAEFQQIFVWIVFSIFAVWNFFIIFWVIKKKINTMDMLKTER